MTIHMVVAVEKAGSCRVVTVRCGGAPLRVGVDEPLRHHATVWESHVTCALCSGEPELVTHPQTMF